MNITFLIGNGFDLGVGLRSKFSDYFPLYEVESLEKDEEIRRFSKEISEEPKAWSAFEEELGQYTNKFDENSYPIFLKQLRDFEEGFANYLEKQEKLLSYTDTSQISTV